MSFILDALKKLERETRDNGSESPEDKTVMQGGRQWGEARRRGLFGWGSIIVAVAALVVAAVALYRSQQPATPTPSAPTTPPVSTMPKLDPSSSASKDVLDAEEKPLTTEKEKAETTTTIQNRHPASPAEEQVTIPSKVVEETEIAQPEEPETAHPVRLLGRHATDREEKSVSDDIAGAPSSSETPEGLPELVLQGTSIVEGRPVAVVNYQRLFEGDFIEGARVIRISDSLVELEFKGKRFKLSF